MGTRVERSLIQLHFVIMVFGMIYNSQLSTMSEHFAFPTRQKYPTYLAFTDKIAELLAHDAFEIANNVLEFDIGFLM